MFLSKSVISKIEAGFIRRRVQRTKPGDGSEVVTVDGTVIGVMFRSALDVAPTDLGVMLRETQATVPFHLIVRRDDGSVEVWSDWTLMPDRYAPDGASLIDDVFEDVISVERFCALVGCTPDQADRLFREVEAARAAQVVTAG